MNELTILLKTDHGKCMYQQIYEYIRDEIRAGKLLQGEKLPSTRSLADYLQVARTTVDTAYAQLLAEGYIQAKPCRGYFVCAVEGLLDFHRELEESGQGAADRRHPFADVSAPEDASEGETQKEDAPQILFDFSPHAITMEYFPYATWKKITKEILVDANSEMFALGDPMGDYALRSTISRYLHSARGVRCTPEQIIIGAGNDYLLMLLEKILGRHVPIAMEDPTYQRAQRVFQSFAYDIRKVPMDENGMNVQALHASGARVAYVMPAHQYPTGIVMPIGRRMELLKWASEQEDRYLIEDDYDSEFRYLGKPIPALQASDRDGRVIYIGTFSKSIAPAIRMGYLVLPQSLLSVYRQNCGFYASTVSRIDQRILNEFMKQGHFERYLNKMRKIYREKRDVLMEELRPLEKDFKISGDQAGLHVLLHSKKGISEEVLLQTAMENGIRLYSFWGTASGKQANSVENDRKNSGKDCGTSSGNRTYGGTVLLGYGGLSIEQIREGTAHLWEAFSKFL